MRRYGNMTRGVKAIEVRVAQGLVLAVAAACLCVLPAKANENNPTLPAAEPVAGPDFGQEPTSAEVRELAQWVVASSNNTKLPFIIIDKVQAKVFVFTPQGQLRGASPALLGMAIGDDTAPGIGNKKLSSIKPAERTTAAGRFVASLDRDVHGEEVLWVDYESSLSLHRVVKGQPKDRRAHRLASPSPLDNRITYGCINVAVPFYEQVVSPAFKGTQGIVYVLPETRPARQVFGPYEVREQAALQTSAPASADSVPAKSN